MQQKDSPRGNWATSAGFILAAAGSAVGIGNLWKFPYLTWENNGGAFVLIYLLCVPVIGLPIMMAELLLGRRAKASAVPAMEKLGASAPGGARWKLVGWIGIVGSATILSYVAVIAGWAVASFFECLKWSALGYTAPGVGAFGQFLQNTGLQFVLSLSFSAITAFIVMKGIAGGIEKANKILMPALFGILLILVVNSFTLSGFGEAMAFLFVPQFSKLSDHAVLEALGQAFFSLSLGMAIMITYGSYMQKSQSIPKAAVIVVGMDTLVAVLACLILYPIIFSFPELRDNISASTTGMLFTTLPPLFYTKMPGGAVLGPIFYLLVTFAALSSTISLLEVTVSLLIDRFSLTRRKATAVSASLVFVLTLLVILSLNPANPLSRFQLFGTADSGFLHHLNQIFFRGKTGFMNFADHLVSNWLLAISGLLTTVFVGWFLDKKVSLDELGLATAEGPVMPYFRVFRFLIRYVAPAGILYILYNALTGVDFS